MLATVLNMLPCSWQAMSQVSCRLMVASRAKISRPDADTPDFFVANMSVRKLSRSERVGSISVGLRAVGSFLVMAGSSWASEVDRAAMHPLMHQNFFTFDLHGVQGVEGCRPIALSNSQSTCELHVAVRQVPRTPCSPCGLGKSQEPEACAVQPVLLPDQPIFARRSLRVRQGHDAAADPPQPKSEAVR